MTGWTAVEATMSSAAVDGYDTVTGGPGRDRLSGGPGRDRLKARDGRRDSVRCGSGRDRVIADQLDRVAADCERVSRAKPNV